MMREENTKKKLVQFLEKISEIKWIHWLLLFLTIALWNITIFLSNTKFAEWGLFNSLFFTYYIGLSIVFINLAFSIFAYNRRFYVYLNVFVVFFYLFATGIFVSMLPSFFAFKFIGHWEYIDRNQVFGLWYHSWPGLFLLFGLLTSPIENPLKYKLTIIYYPILYRIVLLFFLYITIKEILNFLLDYKNENSKYSILLSLIIISLFDWIGQDFFNAQSIAFLLFLSGFWILCNSYKKFSEPNLTTKEILKFSIKELVLYLIIQFTLIVTHLLTAVTLLVTSLFFILTYVVKILRSGNLGKRNKIYIAIGTVGIFLIFLAAMFSSQWVRLRISEILRGNFTFEPIVILRTLEDFTTTNPARLTIISIRLVLSSFFFVIVILTLFRKLRKREKISTPISSLLLAFVVISLIFTFFYVSDELIQRLYLFSIPLVLYSIFTIFKSQNKKTFFIIILVLCPLFLISKYGNSEVELVSYGELRAIEYLEENYKNKTIIMSNLELLRGNNYENFKTIKLSSVEFNGSMFVYANDSITPLTSDHVIVFTKEYYFRSTIFRNEQEPYEIIDLLLNTGDYILVYNEDLNFIIERITNFL
ncbi:MAG: hypothetical protein KAR08_11840 [Candidatus Heimdallarchaeota archaeon]|nr:hypothetical protein [Candidatus Heimdallarchaeota archaeon]